MPRSGPPDRASVPEEESFITGPLSRLGPFPFPFRILNHMFGILVQKELAFFRNSFCFFTYHAGRRCKKGEGGRDENSDADRRRRTSGAGVDAQRPPGRA